MKVFIVYWHYEKQSFNQALLQEAIKTLKRQGHEVKTSDLYQMQFNPVSGPQNFINLQNPDAFKQQSEEMYANEHGNFSPIIQAEIDKLDWCDLLIFQFPLWWFGLPAVLKGWVDQVFTMGHAYGNGKFYDTGAFKNKKALLSLTTGGPESAYVKGGWNGDIHSILKPIQRGIFYFVGFQVLRPFISYGPAHVSLEERKDDLQRFSVRLESIFEESAIDLGSY